MKKIKKGFVLFLVFTLLFSAIPAENIVRAEENQGTEEATPTVGPTEEPSEETPGETPARLSFSSEKNVITITKNSESVKAVHVMYSEVAVTVDTWYQYYTAGKQNTDINGARGYMTKTLGTDVSTYICKQAGYYYFWSDGAATEVVINQEDMPAEPTFVKGEGDQSHIITVSKNGTDVTGFNVMYSENVPPRTTWVTYYTTGKLRQDVNGKSGYKGIVFAQDEDSYSYVCRRAGYYNFWVMKKLYTVYVPEMDIPEDIEPEISPTPEPTPIVEVQFTQSGNKITIDQNGAGVTGVNVMFSATVPEKNTWTSYYTTGKLNKDINGVNGYKGLKFDAEGNITYTCKYAGNYYFWSQNKRYDFVVEESQIPEEEKQPVPTPVPDALLNKDENVVTIDRNGSGITRIHYMFSKEQPATTTWTCFVNTGKQLTVVNGNNGYEALTLEEEQTPFICRYVGWYSFWVQDKMYSFEITNGDFTGENLPDTVPEQPEEVVVEPVIGKENNRITIDKNGLSFGEIKVMYATAPVERETWVTFYTTGKLLPEINTDKGYKVISVSGDKVTLSYFRAGHYYFWINNREYHVELTAAEVPEHPYGEVYANANTFTISENEAEITSLIYTYTEQAPTYTDEIFNKEELIALGKNYTETNSVNGFVTVVAPYDGAVITARKAGFYTFVFHDASGEHAVTFEVTAENIPVVNEAGAVLAGNVITIHDNDSNLTNVSYIYSPDYYFYTTPSAFVAKGKEDTGSNTRYGYRTLKAKTVEVPEYGTVTTYDRVSLTVETAGYYVLQFTDDSGKHGQTFYVTQDAIDASKPAVTVNDNVITASTEALEGWTLKSALYICTPEEYSYTTWADFVAQGKENVVFNSTKGYLVANATDGVAKITCKVPGFYTLLMSYYSDENPDKVVQFAKTVEVSKYLSEIRLSLDGVSCDAGALVTDKEATDEYRASNTLYLKDEEGNYTALDKVKTGYYSQVIDAKKIYQVYFGTEIDKTGLGAEISDASPSAKLNYYSTKLTLTDLDAECNPYALAGETYRVTLSTGDRAGKQIPLRVTVRQEGAEINYSYNYDTGVITIPNVAGRITIKAMANRRYNHINIELNAMGGNIYDATWGNPVNYVYKASDISGEMVLLPTPMSPANSETVNFAGWYKDINYTQKVTTINTDDYAEGQTLKLYAKWILAATSYRSSGMYYAYKGNIFDIRGVNSSGNYIKTTYGDGGYSNYYYYNGGSAYPYTRNSTSDYGGTSLSFVNTANASIFKQLTTNLYYAQVMATQGSYVTVNYIFVNTGSTPINNLTFGACADVQIASNDSAAINAGMDANGEYLVMEDGANYAFRLYTLDANQYWIGGYSSSYCYNNKGFRNNVFNNSRTNSNHYDKKFKLGRDSALAFSFIDQTVPAGGAIVKSVKLGVGSMAEMGKNSGANVTLIGCGGTWNGSALKVLTSSGSTVSLAGNVPVREGYSFLGWNTSSDGRGTSYSAGATVGSATLYAIWEKIVAPSYTVYNKSVVKNNSNVALSKAKADITLFYNSGQNAIDQADFEVEAASADNDFTAVLKLNTEEAGYCLPDNISITVGDKALVQGTDYSYSHTENSDTAELTIKAAKITGDITITAIGIQTPVKVPVVSVDTFKELSLKETADISLTLDNVDAINQKYYYRWYKAPANVNADGTAIAQTTDTLHLTSSTTANAGTYYFYCVVTTTRVDNKQSAKVVSDVVTVVVNKKPIDSSSIITEKDEDDNPIGYHVSNNPGNGVVTYTYYIDEECTIKTSAENGAGITGGKPTVNGEYFIKANIAETNNYLSYDTAPVQYYVAGLPVVQQDGRNVTILNNDSALSSYKYIYTPDYYEYTTWAKFVAKGKENISINSKIGYKGKTGTVEGTASSLDNTKFSFTKAGYYTFLLTYAGGKTYTTCLLVSEPDLLAGVPYVTQEYVNDNHAILVNNNESDPGSLKSARYIYTGAEEYTTDKWAEFVAKGKENIAANTSTGYRIVKPTRYVQPAGNSEEEMNAEESEPETGVLTLDGEKILLPREGYYLFWLTYVESDSTVKEKQVVVRAGQDITGLDNVGMNITYFDTTPTGYIQRIDYQYFGETEPEIVTTGTQDFTSDKKVTSGTIERNDVSAVEFSFQVDRYGWYLVRVMDNGVVGTKYYKINIEQESTDEYKIVLSIDGGLITASDSEDPTNQITKIKFEGDETYKKGNTITANTTGVHTILVVDSKGYTYTLKANILTLERSTEVSTTSLEKQIASAKSIIDGCQLVESTEGITRAGTYAPESAAADLRLAIEAAEQAAELKESQVAVNTEYKNLTAAITEFKGTIVIVDAKLVTVNNSTVTIKPSASGYDLTSVVYNVNNKTDKTLTPLAFASWAGISTRPYVKSLTFDEEGKLEFTDVPNGVYTFLITQQESTAKKQYVEYGVVHNESTEKDVATSELSRYLEAANATIARGKRGADAAQPGESYVPEANYDLLLNAIASATAMKTELTENASNTLEVYDDIIPEMVKLHAAIISFENKLVTKPTEEATELTINTDDYTNVVISKSDLVRASVAYGNYSSWAKFSKAGYVTLQAENGEAVYTGAQYNGIYTALCTYTDGTQVYKTFEISAIAYPFTVSQQNGEITLDLEATEAILIGYQYSDMSGLAEEEFLPINLVGGTTGYTVPALGNGIHTVIVKTADHTYYQTVDVDSCTGPVIVQYNGKLGIFTHGFTYSYVAYAHYSDDTGYSDWSQMYTTAQYCGQNQWYDPASFPEEKYTFYFRADDSANSVFKNYAVVR
ncbi:MAG: InlB B-repeat-containing protein [Lachnospiraceae bacterium]|nr:InlB B-repeat-containing protein [Lachnospiraceae bacterium]